MAAQWKLGICFQLLGWGIVFGMFLEGFQFQLAALAAVGLFWVPEEVVLALIGLVDLRKKPNS